MKFLSLLALGLLALSLPATVHADVPAVSPYAKWKNGPSSDPGYFPLAVWMQSSRNAEKFRAAGINTYVAFSDDLNDQTLIALKNAGMKLIYEQNPASLKYVGDSTIIGWMHGDEPDNAQELPDKKGYGPPILPQKIIDEYTDMVKADPTRPVMLNLDQSVAYNDWVGRGTRTGHAEDYPEYIKGADLVSFDIYPVAGGAPQVEGKLWYVAKGVDHLVQIGHGQKVVWNCIETSHISTKDKIATPHQVRAEVWMSIIHGSCGIIYFLHEFSPFKEAAILDNPEMLAAVTAIDKQIASLAPVLNMTGDSETLVEQTYATDALQVHDSILRKYQDAFYLFSVMHETPGKITFTLPGVKGDSKVTVLGENRTIDAKDGVFTDTFAPWDVHIYQIKD